MPGRKYDNGSGYRYGFNGKEKNDEISGEGNSYDFGARIYDPRIGRWLSTDIVTKPFITPYNYSSNDPVNYLDPNGEDNIHFYYAVVRQYVDGKLLSAKINKFYTVEKTNTPNVFVHHKVELRYDGIGNGATVSTTKPSVDTRFYPDVPGESSGLTKSYLGLVKDDDRKTLIKFIDEYGVSKQSVDGNYTEVKAPGTNGSDRLKKTQWWGDVFKEKKFQEDQAAEESAKADFVLGALSIFGGEELLIAKIFGRTTKVAEAASVISKTDLLRIENAATKINKSITVVGSRAKGTAGAYSDWDYVIEGLTNKEWKKIKNSLPGSKSVMDNTPRNIDIFKGSVRTNEPHVTINPRPR